MGWRGGSWGGLVGRGGWERDVSRNMDGVKRERAGVIEVKYMSSVVHYMCFASERAMSIGICASRFWEEPSLNLHPRPPTSQPDLYSRCWAWSP